MNLTATMKKSPTWATTLWVLLLNRCNDGTTNAAAAAAAFCSTGALDVSSCFSSGLRYRNKRRNGALPFVVDDNDGPKSAMFVATAEPEAIEMTRPAVSSVTRINLPCPIKKNVWTQFVPAVDLLKGDQQRVGHDVTVEWKVDDDLTQVARSMLNDMDASLSQDTPVLVDHLAHCMDHFQSFCLQHLMVASPWSGSSYNQQEHPDQKSCIQGFRARLVCSRGSSGTKCPKWHVDHVPVRWIQSLVGPGCDYVEQSLAHDDDFDQLEKDWNDMKELYQDDDDDYSNKVKPIPGPSHLQFRQAEEQEATILVGNRWNEFAIEPYPFVPPVLHKSPSMPFYQGRVLLTMDVIAPFHDHDD